jgi:hypothetical protein
LFEITNDTNWSWFTMSPHIEILIVLVFEKSQSYFKNID